LCGGLCDREGSRDRGQGGGIKTQSPSGTSCVKRTSETNKETKGKGEIKEKIIGREQAGEKNVKRARGGGRNNEEQWGKKKVKRTGSRKQVTRNQVIGSKKAFNSIILAF
jgi:hypothetical protein